MTPEESEEIAFIGTELFKTGLFDIAAGLFLVKFGLVESLPGGLIVQEMAASLKSIVAGILQIWLQNSIFLIADTAIVWRAWALWAENRLINWTLLIMLLADIGGLFCLIDRLGISIADAIVDTESSINLNLGNSLPLDWISAALNLTVNIVATLLIAHRTWTHHQSTQAILRNKKTQVEAILLLMVESGVIFGMVQATAIIFSALDIHAANFAPIAYAKYFISGLYTYSAALNPVALVILIQTGNTYEHSVHLEDISSLKINSVPNAS
ncbi:hypothetical protein BT96DRAFT_1057605 [Gymnopus androsaceus JB14]|uniref:Uncharacterized protein n=1 Tax=Gymnopus androsaceus JB14 TaxID=1447944 RepID=A0A6A4H5B7_9AGAR|nr:hypothetical protein BT96DRAFT_1057605 [Gymnopus androsaceus JB14]